MQIVIDIPEDTYNHLHNGGSIGASLMIENVIKNGTPLPKHGRLIDADALKNEWKNGFHKKIVDALMDDAPTIIEADKGSEGV